MTCKRILFALDLEGVNNVVGEPYSGLVKDSPQWHVAKKQAALEINAAADALFASGAEKIGLWDNHAGGGNIDASDVDPRISLISYDKNLPRMYFADGEYDCICFFGYHAMEGTLGGVLAHTMSSKIVQYYKLNGKYIGEIDMDAYIAAEKGMPAVLFAAQEKFGFSDDELVDGLFNSAGICTVVAENASISGAKGGCQAECGTASAAAASALTELLGGTPEM